MAEYLFSRTFLAPPLDVPPEVVAGAVFFQFSAIKGAPFGELSAGETMWWVDLKTRRVGWELRTNHVFARRIESVDEGFSLLRRIYGLFAEDVTDYNDQLERGWLLAWAADVAGPVDFVLPAGVRAGRNGYRRITNELRHELEAAGMPSPRAEVIATTPPWMGVDRTEVLEIESRHIPLEVKRLVWARDQNRCQWPGCDATTNLHVDHIKPFSRGGSSSDPHNLQLLCAHHNLAKGAQDSTPPVAETVRGLGSLARSLGRRPPAGEGEIPALLVAAVESGESELAWSVYCELKASDEISDGVRQVWLDDLDALGSRWPDRDRWADRQAWERIQLRVGQIPMADARSFLASKDDEVAAEAAFYLAERIGEGQDDNDERRELLERAAGARDPFVAGMAHFYLAGIDTEKEDEHLRAAVDLGDPDVVALVHLFLADQALGEPKCDRRKVVRHAREAAKSSVGQIQAMALLILAKADAVLEPEYARVYARHAAQIGDEQVVREVAALLEQLA